MSYLVVAAVVVAVEKIVDVVVEIVDVVEEIADVAEEIVDVAEEIVDVVEEIVAAVVGCGVGQCPAGHNQGRTSVSAIQGRQGSNWGSSSG